MPLKINLFIKRVIIKSIPIKRPNNRMPPESPSLKSNRINERKTSAVPKSFCKTISVIGSKIIMKLCSFVENAVIFILWVFRYFAIAKTVVNFANSDGWSL